MNSQNPYDPPQAPCQPDHRAGWDLPVLPQSRWNEIDVSVIRVERHWFTRKLELAGSIHCELSYDAAGNGERLYLDNGLLLTTSPMHWKIVWPQIDFYLKYKSYLVPTRIDVAASVFRLLSISAFRLTVAGRTIYNE